MVSNPYTLLATLLSTRTWYSVLNLKDAFLGFPGGTVVKNLPANAGDAGSSPGLGRSHMPQSG